MSRPMLPMILFALQLPLQPAAIRVQALGLHHHT